MALQFVGELKVNPPETAWIAVSISFSFAALDLPLSCWVKV
jgi:hypothetical protein